VQALDPVPLLAAGNLPLEIKASEADFKKDSPIGSNIISF
jgi:hypothetical protein